MRPSGSERVRGMVSRRWVEGMEHDFDIQSSWYDSSAEFFGVRALRLANSRDPMGVDDECDDDDDKLKLRLMRRITTMFHGLFTFQHELMQKWMKLRPFDWIPFSLCLCRCFVARGLFSHRKITKWILVIGYFRDDGRLRSSIAWNKRESNERLPAEYGWLYDWWPIFKSFMTTSALWKDSIEDYFETCVKRNELSSIQNW